MALEDEMNWKKSVTAIASVGCLGCVIPLSTPAPVGHRAPTGGSAAYVKDIAGFTVRLVAVEDHLPYLGQMRRDHVWTPDGAAYEGPGMRLQPTVRIGEPQDGERRFLTFEINQPKLIEAKPLLPNTTGRPYVNPNGSLVDVYAYLDGSKSPRGGATTPEAGPGEVGVSLSIARDTGGNVFQRAPESFTMGFQVHDTAPKSIVVGIAKGDFRTVAKGALSLKGLAEERPATVATGRWGRIEVTHLKPPAVRDSPPPTYRFLLLGGEAPPRSERKVMFYDVAGECVASCGDGPDHPGFTWAIPRPGGFPLAASFEIQERTYEFARFSSVSMKAPQGSALSGAEGAQRAVGSSLGKVVGVLKFTKDGPWMGGKLYAANGRQWVDPLPELSRLEDGGYESMNPGLEGMTSILFAGNQALLSPGTATTCEVYAADSPNGPQKERLTTWSDAPFRTPLTEILCKRSDRPYMQVEIRVGGGSWRTLDLIPITEQMRKEANDDTGTAPILGITFREGGEIAIRQDGARSDQTTLHWQVGEQRVQTIAHLKDGSTAVLQPNMGNMGSNAPRQQRSESIWLTKQQDGVQVFTMTGFTDLNKIESIEIQTQDLKSAVSIPVHSPMN